MAQPNSEPDAFFDHFGKDRPTGFGIWLTRRLAHRIFRFAAADKDTRLLEIGPGRGDFADICLGRVARYHAIEPNKAMADALSSRGAGVTCAIVPPMPALKEKFDIVVMVNVMEHMNSLPDALSLSKQVREILDDGGRFVICSPDYVNWRTNFFNCDFSHNYVTSRRRLEQLLINAGFTDIRYDYAGGVFGGFFCLLTTALAGWLPFGYLNAVFPRNRIFYKLYKLQLSLMRKTIVSGARKA